MRKVKKKMKKGSEAAQRIKRLREETLDENQAQFAQRLGVDQARISQYESGKLTPHAEVYVTLGNLAPFPESLWFWEQIGIKRAMISSKADEILKERVQVPLADKTPEGIEISKNVLQLPDRFVPNPASTVCLVVDKKSAGLVFSEGDVVVLEPSAEPQNLQPYWNQIVLVEFTEPNDDWSWPLGLFMGRLRYKRYGLKDLSYWVTVGQFNDSETVWRPGRSGGAVIIGTWDHPGPPKEPDPGSEREKAEAEHAKLHAEYSRIQDKCTHGSRIVPTPELEEADRRLREAKSRIMTAGYSEMRKAQDEAEEQAPEELKVWEGCKIIGRVVAWFQSPNPAGEKG